MENRIVLDCSGMVDEASVHDAFARTLNFPEYYGRTLDALYDLLSTASELNLVLTHTEAIAKLFRYGDNLMLTLRDATETNPNFTFEVQE